MSRSPNRRASSSPSSQDDLAKAAERLRKTLADGKASAQDYLDLAGLEASLGRPDEGARILREGVDRCPEDAVLPAQLGLMFARGGRADLAPNAFAVALQRSELDWVRRQAAFYETQLGGHENADRLLTSLLAENPRDTETLFVRALLRFAEGRYREAWTDYRSRWQVEGFVSPRKETARPVWNGAKAERLLVWREQGIGDEIQFLRFLPKLLEHAETVLYEGDPRLTPLLKRSFPDLDIHPIRNGELLPNAVEDAAFDCHAPLGDSGCLLGGIGFGAAEAYLAADPSVTAKLRHQFETSFGARKLIGLAWFSKNAEHGAGRSVALEALLPVLSRDGYEFVSVQYGDVARMLEDFHAETSRVVRNFSGIDLYSQIDQSAAVLSALDGLITIDNTTAHLAGALGVPTALLLPRAVDWRWQCPTDLGNGRIYASHRLFRQDEQGDWQKPVAALEAAMDELFQRA